MGKSQKKRAMRRHNPMRVPDSHLPKGLASASSSSSKTDAILPILQRMESVDASERKWACVAVSNLIQNDPSTRRLLQGKNIVGALITRLTDSEEEVIIEATGCLRNLCIDGGYDICAEMYNKNILTPLKSFISKISTTLSQYLDSSPSVPENARKLVYEFSENVITILWCLSETSNRALNAINEIHLIPFLMSFLAARNRLPLAPVTAAAQSLYVLSDDNQPAISDLRANSGYLTCLMDIVQSDQKPHGKEKEPADPRSLMLRVLAAGILRNLSYLPLQNGQSNDIDKTVVLPLIQPIIASVPLIEYGNRVQELIIQAAAEPAIEKLSLKDTPKSDHKSSAEKELEQLESKLRTVQLALEILTGACATLPDPEYGASPGDEGGEGENDDIDEDLNIDHESDVAMQEGTPSTGGQSSTFLPSLVHPLLALIHPIPLSFPPLAAPSPHPPTTSALSAIHVNALECLNNVFLSLATTSNPDVAADHASGQKVWDEIWAALEVVGTETGLGQEQRQRMWEVAVGVLWGIGNVWKGCLVPNEERVTLLIRLCEATSDSQTRVKCIGALECLAHYRNSVNANKVIAEYFLSLLPSAESPSRVQTEPLIQTLSALIDIYSDEDMPYDINFRRGGFLTKLTASVEEVKKAVRAIDRKEDGGRTLRRRGEEVRDNLVAFIQYRRDLRLES